METKVFYPIGEQDFKFLREDGCLYVDKTEYIARLLDSRGKYFFLTRPRRFGKSLFLSTLHYFFEGRRELFKGLFVDSIAWDWATYPVLHLDLNQSRYADQGLLDSVLDNWLKKEERKWEVDFIAHDHSSRFANVIEAANRKSGKPVVVLIDEYDKPLVGNLNNDNHFEHYRSRLASLYSNFKSSARHIKMVFLTGVSRFSKLSVFSDLNNLRDITFSDNFADICGITDDELREYFQPGIKALADKLSITHEEARLRLKCNYDGYRFAPCGSDIYNPWSLLNAMEESRISSYWARTGMPTIIAETLRRTHADLRKVLNVKCPFDTLTGLDLRSPDPTALLYQTGYLTLKDYDQSTEQATLGLPNIEIKRNLFEVLLPYYVSIHRQTPSHVVYEIEECIREGRPEELIRNLDIFLAGIPYDLKMENENNLQNALYILLTLIGIDAEAEVHTSDGRIDLCISTSSYIYIIELKFNRNSETAHSQITEKGYDFPYRNDTRRIFRIGVNFSPKTRHLDPPSISTE